jgi:hypothetical protein
MGSGRVENKLIFYGLILVAFMMVANVLVTETFAKAVSRSLIGERSTLSTNLSLGYVAPRPIGTTATITGTVSYNDLPVYQYTTKPAEFWLEDLNTRTYPPINAIYDSSTGAYSVPDIPPGNYVLHMFIDCAEPYDGKKGYPGDLIGETSFEVVDGQSSVSQHIHAREILHVASPIDNSVNQGYFTTLSMDTWDTYSNGDMSFIWDSLQEASEYGVSVLEYTFPSTYVRTLLSTQTSSLSIKLDLPANQNGTWYDFILGAVNGAGTYIGQMTIPYDDGYGGSYFFRVNPVANVTISPGVNVAVSPTSDLTLTFDNITSAGYVTEQGTSTPSAPTLNNLAGQYCDIEVTADYSGNVTIRLAYDDTNMTLDRESTLQMMQYAPIPGDVVNYGQVNILDIVFMAERFGATPASPNWNAAADVTGSQYLVPDGKIDIRDIYVCAVNFAKTSQWTSITTHVDLENNLVYGETTHFSIIGIH